MAKSDIGLPEGFVIEEESSGLPPGFEIETSSPDFSSELPQGFEIETTGPDLSQEDQYQGRIAELQKQQDAALQEEARIQAINAAANDPKNWSSTRFKKEMPKPQTVEEQAVYDATLASKEAKEQALTNKLLPPDLQKKPPVQITPERLAKDFGTGVAGTVEGVGGALKWLGADDLGNMVSNHATLMKDTYEVPDPGFIDQVAAGVGSMATFLIPGLGISKGAQALAFMPRLATWLGVSASSILESSVEAGNAYQTMLKKGMDEKQAGNAATLDFWLNLPVLVFTNKFGLFGDKGGAILKGLKSSAGEGIQEFTQQIIGNIATKDPVMRGSLEAAGVGAIVGGGSGALIGGLETIDDKLSQKQPQPTQTQAPAPEIAPAQTPAPIQAPIETPVPQEGLPAEVQPQAPVEIQAPKIEQGKKIDLSGATHKVIIDGEEHPAIVTKNTAPNEKPWRVTYFEPSDGQPIAHIDMETPDDYPTSFINGFGKRKSIEVKPISKKPKAAPKFTYEQKEALSIIRNDIAGMEAPRRIPIIDPETNETTGWMKSGDMMPYLQNAGIVKKEYLRIIDKALNGKNLTEKQHSKLVDVIDRWLKEQEKINEEFIRSNPEEVPGPEAAEIIRSGDQEEPGASFEEGATDFDFGENVKEKPQSVIPGTEKPTYKKPEFGAPRALPEQAAEATSLEQASAEKKQGNLFNEAGFVLNPIPEIPEGAIENLYQKYVNRFQSIENITALAKKEGAIIHPGEDPGKLARAYLGLGPKAQTFLEKNTFKYNPDGTQEVTGEGLKPILDDFSKAVPDPEADNDLNDFLIASRYLKDLQRPRSQWDPENIATPQQLAASRQVIDELNRKYGDLSVFEDTANRLYEFQKRLLHLLVDSGNMSQGQFDNIVSKNPNYVPFERILGEEEKAGGAPKAKNIFTGARSFVKRIKGSAKPIYNPVETMVKNVFKTLDTAERNNVARSIAKLTDVLPDMITPEKIPIIPLAKIQHRAAIDLEFLGQLKKFAEGLGAKFIRGGQPGRALGYYHPATKEVERKFATPREVIAHETGHFLDHKYGLKQRFHRRMKPTKFGVPGKEIEVTKELLEHMDRMGESENRKGKPAERFADGFEWWLTNRDLAKKDLPIFSKEMESIISEIPDLKPLLSMRPSPALNLEKMTETVFGQSPFVPKGPIIEYYENGEKHYMKVTPNLYAAMKGMDDISIGPLIKLLSVPTHWLRVGATITPEFMLRNPIRDQLTALMQTKIGFKPFFDTFGAMADILGGQEIYYEWIRSGGAYSTFTELSRENLSKKLKELKGNKSLLSKLNIIARAQDLSQLFEQATRLAVFKAARKKGMSPIEAGFESREATVDFGRRGSQTKDINAVIAFFNAGVQGLDKSIRSAAKDPAGFTLKGLSLITIPSILFYLYNRDDDKYKELPRWQKDLFWCFRFPGSETFIRIPKPFLYGMVFGSAVERFLEYYDSKDPKSFEGLSNSILSSATPVSIDDPWGSILPTAIKPWIENWVNYSFFRQAPLVPESRKRLLPEEQYAKNTSETAKALGRMMKVSPSKIDNLISGYFGGTGRYATDISDLIVRKMKGKESAPERPGELSDIPLVKGFVTRPPESSPESLNNFYDRSQKVSAAYDTYKRLIKEGRSEDAKRILKEHPDLRFKPTATKAAKMIKKISVKIDKIIASKNIDEETKRKNIRKLETTRLEIAKKALRRMDEKSVSS